MEVQLLHAPPKELAISAIRTCWKSFHKEDGFGDNDAQLVRRIIGFSHESTLEHIQYTFYVKGLSRACFDDQTEILTEKRGFVKFCDLRKDERVATLDINHNIIYQKPTDYICYFYEGDMIKGENTKFDFLVTPDHRMYVSKGYGKGSKKTKIEDRPFEFVEAENLLNSTGKFYRSSTFSGRKQEKFSLSSSEILKSNENQYRYTRKFECDMKLFLKFLGRYISDGSVDTDGKGHYRIAIVDSIDQEDKLKSMINEMGFNSSVYKKDNTLSIKFYDRTLYKWIEDKVGKGSKNKRIPYEILQLDPEYLYHLYEELIEGDGHRREKFPDAFYTSSKTLADNFQELIIKLGWSSVLHSFTRDTNFKKDSVCYQITVNKPCFNKPRFKGENYKRSNITRQSYSGYVYCVSVPNQIILTRRNGKLMWSGNCLQELARHRIASYSVESTRYTLKRILNGEENIEDIMVSTGDPDLDELTHKHMKELRDLINRKKIPNDTAKYGITENYPVNLQFSMNIRSLRNFISLRSSKAAHKEINELTERIRDVIPEDHWIFFEDL